MNKFPWEERSEKYKYSGTTFMRKMMGESADPYVYEGIKEYIRDNPNQVWRKGDIVKFEDGLINPGGGWREWFPQDRSSKERLWSRKSYIPKYADNQLAIIIGRYRKIKFKWAKFVDYGVVVMMLTGNKVGKIRHYWSKKPFKMKVRYPQKIKLKAIPSDVIDIYNKDREDTNESRNEMLYEMYKIFH